MSDDLNAEYVVGSCRLWDFLASDYWRCLCGQAYRRDNNERVPAMDDRTGPLRHSDGLADDPFAAGFLVPGDQSDGGEGA